MSMPDGGIFWSDTLVITFLRLNFLLLNAMFWFYSSSKILFLASGDFRHLLITFASSLGPDQGQLIQAV